MFITHIIHLIPPLLQGAKVTIEVMILSMIVAFMLAFVGGFARLSKFSFIRIFATVYIEIFRGTSLLVQLYWLYFVLPMFGIELPKLEAAVIAMGLNYGAYGTEIVRSCILAVPKGQTEASIALNMTPSQRMRFVILPQAFVMMLPAFGNLMIELLKGTALVSLITLSDLTYQAMVLRTSTFQTTAIFTLLLLMYFVIASPFTLGVRWLERRASAGRG